MGCRAASGQPAGQAILLIELRIAFGWVGVMSAVCVWRPADCCPSMRCDSSMPGRVLEQCYPGEQEWLWSPCTCVQGMQSTQTGCWCMEEGWGDCRGLLDIDIQTCWESVYRLQEVLPVW